METTDFCSYELSKRLKDCGFDKPCDCYYTNGYANDNPEDISRVVKLNNGSVYNHNKVIGADGEHISAVPLWQAQKWLREKKMIDVLVYNCACGYGWEISKADPQSRGTTLKFYDDNGEDRDSGMWLTYENALSAGITVALELIEQENTKNYGL